MKTYTDTASKIMARKDFLRYLDAFYNASVALSMAWDKLDEEANALTDGGKYPFLESFDELTFLVADWVDDLEEKFKAIQEFYPTITVKELSEYLGRLDDDTQVVIGAEDGKYYNIISTDGVDENYQALTLNTKDTFDTRQF